MTKLITISLLFHLAATLFSHSSLIPKIFPLFHRDSIFELKVPKAAVPYSRRKKNLCTVFKVRLQYKNNNVWTNCASFVILPYLHRTLPYLFRKFSYLDE